MAEAPSAARVIDCIVRADGGYALPADRARARALMAADPQLRERLRVTRQFARAAGRRAAAAGVRQLIILGAGLPAVPPAHAGARDECPGTAVAYADADEIAAAITAAEYEDDPGIVSVRGDIADPAAVLADPAVAKVIDPGEPVCAVLAGALTSLDPASAAEVVRAWSSLLAPGSWIAVSAAWFTDPALLEAVRAVAPAPVHSHSPEDVGAMLAGLELVPPGVVSARSWLSGMAWTPQRARACVLAGAGIVRLAADDAEQRPGARLHLRCPLVPALLERRDGHGLQVVQSFGRLACRRCLPAGEPQRRGAGRCCCPRDLPDRFAALLCGITPRLRVTVSERAGSGRGRCCQGGPSS